MFQSAVRIAVWLKHVVSMPINHYNWFQSAVRIAVWLKLDVVVIIMNVHLPVSIRRADRCLVEGYSNQRYDTPA